METSSSASVEQLTKAFHRDLKLFTVNQDRRRALVFPAFNSASRGCLTALVEDKFPGLTTFQIGDENEPRTVVCRQDSVVKTNVVLGVADENDRNVENSRRNVGEKSSSSSGRKQRRPDRAVYVPPASNRRSSSQRKNGQLIEAVNSSPSPPPPAVNLNVNPELAPFQREVESVLGSVRLMSPQNDYLAIESGSASTTGDVIADDLLNVVELYDFPADFKTDNLEECLHRNLKLVNYYDLRWVDDTHALAIFTDLDVAEKAIHIQDPFIKFRPFWCASPQSHTKARILKLSSETTRFKPRPDTSTVMAKRLLARALGMPALAGKRSETERLKRGAVRSK